MKHSFSLGLFASLPNEVLIILGAAIARRFSSFSRVMWNCLKKNPWYLILFLNQNIKLFFRGSFSKNLSHRKCSSCVWNVHRDIRKVLLCWSFSHSFIVQKDSREKIKFFPLFWHFFDPEEIFSCLGRILFLAHGTPSEVDSRLMLLKF